MIEDTLANLLERIEEIKVARLRPGDVIVVKIPAHVEQDDLIDMYAEVKRWFPGHDVRFTVDVDIEVVRPECEHGHVRTWGSDACVVCGERDDPPDGNEVTAPDDGRFERP